MLQSLHLYWEILIMLSQFRLTFLETQKGMFFFIAQLRTILLLIGISLDLVLLMLLMNFMSRSRLKTTYISLISYSSLSFSAACTAIITHRNCLFYLHQQNESSISQVMFQQVSSHCKMILKAKIANANETKKSIILKKLGSSEFWWIPKIVISKYKSAILHLFNCYAFDEAILFAFLTPKTCFSKLFYAL